MTTKKKTTAKKLPELTLEDALRQAITLVVAEEPMLDDLGAKERSLLVRAIYDEHGDGLEAIIRSHTIAGFFDLFGEDEDEDEDDEDEDDEDEDEGEDEDEDE